MRCDEISQSMPRHESPQTNQLASSPSSTRHRRRRRLLPPLRIRLFLLQCTRRLRALAIDIPQQLVEVPLIDSSSLRRRDDRVVRRLAHRRLRARRGRGSFAAQAAGDTHHWRGK